MQYPFLSLTIMASISLSANTCSGEIRINRNHRHTYQRYQVSTTGTAVRSSIISCPLHGYCAISSTTSYTGVATISLTPSANSGYAQRTGEISANWSHTHTWDDTGAGTSQAVDKPYTQCALSHNNCRNMYNTITIQLNPAGDDTGKSSGSGRL